MESTLPQAVQTALDEYAAVLIAPEYPWHSLVARGNYEYVCRVHGINPASAIEANAAAHRVI